MPPRKTSKANQLQLEDLLRDSPKDEKQGATAIQGFGFQQWWAASHVAEALGQSDDFAVAMEFKEDVAILNSSTTPTAIEFCQTKKSERTGGWTLPELHKKGATPRTGEPTPSTLAKLYKRRHEFIGHPTKLRFISNVPVKVPNESDGVSSSDETTLDSLPDKQKDAVRKALASQLGIDESKIDLTDIRLHRTNLPLGNQELYVGGQLSQLCETGAISFQITQPVAAARMLASELQSKASSTSYSKSYDELKRRIYTKKNALDMLAALSNAKPNLSTLIDTALSRLDTEAHNFSEVQQIRTEKVRVCADAVDRTNLLFKGLAAVLLEAKSQLNNSSSKLGELMESLVRLGKAINLTEFTGKSPGYINAVSLLVIYDGIDLNLFTAPAGEKSKEEQ